MYLRFLAVQRSMYLTDPVSKAWRDGWWRNTQVLLGHKQLLLGVLCLHARGLYFSKAGEVT